MDNQEILIWFGAAIGPEAFVVGSEVMESFVNKGDSYRSAFQIQVDGLWHCDLYQLARIELEALGVKHIYGGGLCTYTDSSRFYSYRRDGENTGRQAHCIWMSQT